MGEFLKRLHWKPIEWYLLRPSGAGLGPGDALSLRAPRWSPSSVMEFFLLIEVDMSPQHRRSSGFRPGGGSAGHTAGRDTAAPWQSAPDSGQGRSKQSQGGSALNLRRAPGWTAKRWRTCENSEKARWQSTLYMIIKSFSLLMRFLLTFNTWLRLSVLRVTKAAGHMRRLGLLSET